MAIYDFSILSWYELGGVDVAQGRRDSYFKKIGEEANYIFTDLPTEYYIQRYENLGISRDRMMCAQVFMTGKRHIEGTISASNWLKAYKQENPTVVEEYVNNTIKLYDNGYRIATLALREDGSLDTVSYFNCERLIAKEAYADRLLYVEHYVTAYDEDGSAYAKRIRTTFVDEEGSTCFEIIHHEVEDAEYKMKAGISTDSRDYEEYLFPNGEKIGKTEFLRRFIRALHLTKEDILILDRPMRSVYIQPLFQLETEAPLYIFLHSGHYYEPCEDVDAVFWNKEYYYYFKHSDKVTAFIVSTETQKLDLQKKLEEQGLYVPPVYVIPASGIERLEYADIPRKPYSLISACRLHPRKNVYLVIEATILAHKTMPQITLDVYGFGEKRYEDSLKQMVKEAQAEEYIHFMGRQNMNGKYTHYEVCATASTWETLGLSMMEACASGNALIGLDVRYGNNIFIQNGGNGYKIPVKLEEINDPKYHKEYIERLANVIIHVFEDRNTLKQFGKKSYEIAKEFLDKELEKKWIQLIEEGCVSDNPR